MEDQQLQLCACCATKYQTIDVYCNSCGFPLQGTKEQQDSHIANRAIKEIDLGDLKNKVEQACSSLYWIAGICALSAIVQIFMFENGDDWFSYLVTAVILVGAFLAFAVWSKTKPLAALISGLALYLIVQILNAMADPGTLASGIIFKIFIIGYLIKGIFAIIEVEKIKKELNIK